MSIRVEFYGIPRSRAGVSSIELAAVDNMRLGEVLAAIATRLPELAAECFDGPRLRAGYVANLGGERFVADPETQLLPGDSLLILSADAGGA